MCQWIWVQYTTLSFIHSNMYIAFCIRLYLSALFGAYIFSIEKVHYHYKLIVFTLSMHIPFGLIESSGCFFWHRFFFLSGTEKIYNIFKVTILVTVWMVYKIGTEFSQTGTNYAHERASYPVYLSHFKNQEKKLNDLLFFTKFSDLKEANWNINPLLTRNFS